MRHVKFNTLDTGINIGVRLSIFEKNKEKNMEYTVNTQLFSIPGFNRVVQTYF